MKAAGYGKAGRAEVQQMVIPACRQASSAGQRRGLTPWGWRITHVNVARQIGWQQRPL
jgi:hypothetical protein